MAELNVFVDILLPGDVFWPSATAALGGSSAIERVLAQNDIDWLRSAAAGIAAQPPEQRIAAMAGLERRETQTFRRVSQAVYDAYYATEAARDAGRQLALHGRRDESPLFDATLLEKVVAHQSGRRRL